MEWLKLVKGLDKLSLVSVSLSLLGYFLISARDIDVIRYSDAWRTIFAVVAILGYLAGSSLGIITLTLGRSRMLTIRGSIIAVIAVIIGVVGLSYIVFASYALYELRHM